MGVLRLDGEPTRYLVTARPPSMPLDWSRRVLAITALALSVLSALFSLVVLVLYLRARTTDVARVIGRLQSGDLGARLTVGKLDEVGRLMHQFNRMADEIERLVGRLKAAERARADLLEELSHDLRTPLTSFQYLVDTLHQKGDDLPAGARKECLDLAALEIAFVVKLVEDLFLLAQVSEPRYRPDSKPVSLVGILSGEVERMAKESSAKGSGLTFRLIGADGPGELVGDPRLLERLFRNALQNAGRFAETAVEVAVERVGGLAEIAIRDDGPGFSPETLRSFGERRVRRPGQRVFAGEISLGLGASIMKSIAAAHGGSVSAGNHPAGGAEVRVRLPLTTSHCS